MTQKRRLKEAIHAHRLESKTTKASTDWSLKMRDESEKSPASSKEKSGQVKRNQEDDILMMQMKTSSSIKTKSRSSSTNLQE